MGDEERRKEGKRRREKQNRARCWTVFISFAGGKGSSSEAGDKARAVGRVRVGP